MTKIVLDLAKSVEENASSYFEKAKKLKKKVEGAQAALKDSLKKMEELKEKRNKILLKQSLNKTEERKQQWYEKFRWFVSSEGFLVIGGRDATSNEIVVKKHTEAHDLVFHTDMAGSPFFVVKTEGKKIGTTKREAADATCTFSRAWKLGLQASPVFCVSPEQVSKKTKSGEFMGKGAFMIYGKTEYVDNRINLAIGRNEEGQVMAGPIEAVSLHCKKYVEIIQGTEKASQTAKYIKHHIGGGIDEIIRALPSGGFKVKK